MELLCKPAGKLGFYQGLVQGYTCGHSSMNQSKNDDFLQSMNAGFMRSK